MASTTSNTSDADVYVGIPVTQDEVVISGSSTSTSNLANDDLDLSNESYVKSDDGLTAFFLGLFLSVICWGASQGWANFSFFLFGPFTGSFESALKNLLFISTFGFFCTLAVCRVLYDTCLPRLLEDGDDVGSKDAPHETDIRNALCDLVELGFLLGFILWQIVFDILFHLVWVISDDNIVFVLARDVLALTLYAIVRAYETYKRSGKCVRMVEHADQNV